MGYLNGPDRLGLEHPATHRQNEPEPSLLRDTGPRIHGPVKTHDLGISASCLPASWSWRWFES